MSLNSLSPVLPSGVRFLLTLGPVLTFLNSLLLCKPFIFCLLGGVHEYLLKTESPSSEAEDSELSKLTLVMVLIRCFGASIF